MSNTFHLAILAGDLKTAIAFYCDVLGCKAGNQEEGYWVDIDFWGNELTLHQSNTRQNRERHHVDMGDVCVPHFGVHLKPQDFEDLKKRLEQQDTQFVDKPYKRFASRKHEQETFFLEDPNGNVIEIKTMMDPKVLFDTALPT